MKDEFAIVGDKNLKNLKNLAGAEFGSVDSLGFCQKSKSNSSEEVRIMLKDSRFGGEKENVLALGR